jgi:hypothetical protein
MPQSIPPGLTQEHVLRALSELDAGIVHPFGPPTRYELVHQGKHYPPKAAVGLACRQRATDNRRPSRNHFTRCGESWC